MQPSEATATPTIVPEEPEVTEEPTPIPTEEPEVTEEPTPTEEPIVYVPTPTEAPITYVPEEVDSGKLYTDRDAIALAQMLMGESINVPDLVLDDGRVISNECQNAACVWSVLGRYDQGLNDSIYQIVANPLQYHGWSPNRVPSDKALYIVYDVLERWSREKNGEEYVGRVLPGDYIFWHGDGKYNYFRNWYTGGGEYWDWSYGDPYS